MAATLNRADVFTEGTALPLGWHWLYFLPAARLDHSGADGHTKRGGFLPPVTLPRRMWAGGRLAFHRPLQIGERALKKSTVADVTTKQGKSGELVFVLVRHEIIGDGGLALLEEQDIVYRGLSSAQPAPVSEAALAPAEPQFSRAITPDPVLLFRFSALTFNSHRIHYDRTYCTDVEGYPGLVVHGNLTATLLLDTLRDHAPDRTVTAFSFRAVAPLYDTAPFRVEGRIDGSEAKLWALNSDGGLAMTGTAAVE
ncbi:MAG: MaoC family dehydratase N-terminal domain-containing protein [Anaerolineae bacterium]|nr:MaoC family dehydratase N-terminal domain-containing protein [Anaerolineae bacterium]